MTKWWVPCQGSELGLSLLCHPAFKNCCPPLDIHSHAMNSVCFLPLGIIHFCPPPVPNSPLCCSHVCSRCACLIYLVPSQKCRFFPHFRSHCCHCFGSCLSEDSLVPGKHTSFSLADFLLHVSHFIFLPGWNQNQVVVPAFQHTINTPLHHREQLEWRMWADQALCNTCSVFWFLPKSAGSSRLLPCGTLTARRH